jgi:hypothetical protein
MSNAKNVTLETILEKLVSIETKLDEIKSHQRDRGPRSTRAMTHEDAHMVKFGQLSNLDHMECAKRLGLSYGQIYSARCGYTFNHVKK